MAKTCFYWKTIVGWTRRLGALYFIFEIFKKLENDRRLEKLFQIFNIQWDFYNALGYKIAQLLIEQSSNYKANLLWISAVNAILPKLQMAKNRRIFHSKPTSLVWLIWINSSKLRIVSQSHLLDFRYRILASIGMSSYILYNLFLPLDHFVLFNGVIFLCFILLLLSSYLWVYLNIFSMVKKIKFSGNRGLPLWIVLLYVMAP